MHIGEVRQIGCRIDRQRPARRLITNTESPSRTGSDQFPSKPVFITSRPLDTMTPATPARGLLPASNTNPRAIESAGVAATVWARDGLVTDAVSASAAAPDNTVRRVGLVSSCCISSDLRSSREPKINDGRDDHTKIA